VASAAAVVAAVAVRATEQSAVTEMALTCQKDLQERDRMVISWMHMQGKDGVTVY